MLYPIWKTSTKTHIIQEIFLKNINFENMFCSLVNGVLLKGPLVGELAL